MPFSILFITGEDRDGRVSIQSDNAATCFGTMTLTSTSDATSIFKEGKLKPGIYKIQNLFAESYLDIHRHSKEVCCRPARDLEDGRGLVRLRLRFSWFVGLTIGSGRSGTLALGML